MCIYTHCTHRPTKEGQLAIALDGVKQATLCQWMATIMTCLDLEGGLLLRQGDFPRDPPIARGAGAGAIRCRAARNVDWNGGDQNMDGLLAPYPYRVGSHGARGEGGDQQNVGGTYRVVGVGVGDEQRGEGGGEGEHEEGGTGGENLHLICWGVAWLGLVQNGEGDGHAKMMTCCDY